MKTYLKSLFPWRWIALFVLYFCIEFILFMAPFPMYYHLGALVTVFVIDLTVGLGQRIDKPYLNVLGLIYLSALCAYFFYVSQHPALINSIFNIK